MEADDTIRRQLASLRAGELAAPPMLIARIEGALVALEVIATGRAPTSEDLLETDSLHDTNSSTRFESVSAHYRLRKHEGSAPPRRRRRSQRRRGVCGEATQFRRGSHRGPHLALERCLL